MKMLPLPLALLGAAFLTSPGVVHAQGMTNLGREFRVSRILLLRPHGSDSLEIRLADRLDEELRDRLRRTRSRVQLVDDDVIAEALQQAEFPRDMVLSEPQSQALAIQVGAEGYSTGWVDVEDGQAVVHYRVFDLGQGGVARDIVIERPVRTGRGAVRGALEAVLDPLAGALKTAMESGDKVRECYEAIRRGRYGRARGRARDAAKDDPGNGAAYLCLAQAAEFEERPDDVRGSLQQLVEILPWYRVGWSRLLSHCLGRSDRSCEAEARYGLFRLDPRDTGDLGSLIGIYLEMDLPDSAIAVLDWGVANGADSLEMLVTKESLCTEFSDWQCSLDLMPILARLRPERVNEDYYAKIIGLAQTVGDLESEVQWSGAATEAFPARTDFWRALGAAQRQAGDLGEAVVAFDHVYLADPTDAAAALAAARSRVEADLFDQDTWRILLSAAEGDASQRRLAAGLMVQFGRRAFQQQQWDLTVAILEQALSLNPPAPTVPPSAFFLGVAYFQQLDQSYRDVQTDQSFTCEVAVTWTEWLDRGQIHILTGREVRPDFADQIAAGYDQYAELVPQVMAALECESSIPSR